MCKTLKDEEMRQLLKPKHSFGYNDISFILPRIEDQQRIKDILSIYFYIEGTFLILYIFVAQKKVWLFIRGSVIDIIVIILYECKVENMRNSTRVHFISTIPISNHIFQLRMDRSISMGIPDQEMRSSQY